MVDLRRDHGVLTGTAYGTGEEVPRTDLALADDTLNGTSKAERLPASKVTGQRRTILAATEHRP